MMNTLHEALSRMSRSNALRPLSRWERGGVRGYGLSFSLTPHPALRADLSRWER